MTAKAQLQQRLALLLAEADELGLKPEEFVPLQFQVPALNADGESISRIYELEMLVHVKDEQISNLTNELERTQQKIETMEVPVELKQLQADVDQANRVSDFYRNLSNDSEIRASQYQVKMEAALEKQTISEEVDRKIKRLEMENCDLRQSKGNIANELHGMKQIFEKLQGRYSAALEEQEKTQLSFRRQLAEHESQKQELSRDNREIEDKYQDLIASMEEFIADITKNFNASQEQARSAQQALIVTLSEMKPLHRFYVQVSDLLRVYECLFKQLLNATEQNVHFRPEIGENILRRLYASENEYQTFQTLRAAFEMDGMHENEDHERLDLARSAEDIQKSISAIGKDVTQFLWALQHRPDAWQLIRHKFWLSR